MAVNEPVGDNARKGAGPTMLLNRQFQTLGGSLRRAAVENEALQTGDLLQQELFASGHGAILIRRSVPSTNAWRAILLQPRQFERLHHGESSGRSGRGPAVGVFGGIEARPCGSALSRGPQDQEEFLVDPAGILAG